MPSLEQNDQQNGTVPVANLSARCAVSQQWAQLVVGPGGEVGRCRRGRVPCLFRGEVVAQAGRHVTQWRQ